MADTRWNIGDRVRPSSNGGRALNHPGEAGTVVARWEDHVTVDWDGVSTEDWQDAELKAEGA